MDSGKPVSVSSARESDCTRSDSSHNPKNSQRKSLKTSLASQRENTTRLPTATMQEKTESDIVEFYKHKSVFITGGTGFVGKATVEKLLRVCPDVENVYTLIRPKSGSDVKTRLTELLDNSLYSVLKEQNPAILSKIIPIAGDITEDELGISPEDQALLIEKVHIVIHSAATVKFDEVLKLSINVNVRGTQRLISLAKRMKKLIALVHVSTAYANCEHGVITEAIYPAPTDDPKKLIETVQWMDDDIVNTITPHLIGNKPNTYTFTKALAEHLLSEESGSLPITIVRPSIVTATFREPLVGWVDNFNGPTGLIAACGNGVLRTLLCHRNKKADLIPLDYPVNLILASAWYLATTRPNSITVYNCCTGADNPLLWGQLEQWGFAFLQNNPISKVMWYPGGSFKSNRLWNSLNDFVIHYVPAYLMDLVARMAGKKPLMLRMYHKINKAVTSLEFFTTHEWKFVSDNMMDLYEKMSPVDQKLFSVNVKEVFWPKYIGEYCMGLRRYVMKQDPSTMSNQRKHMRKMYWVHKITQFFLILLAWRAIMFRSTTARQLWTFLLGMTLRMAKLLPLGQFN